MERNIAIEKAHLESVGYDLARRAMSTGPTEELRSEFRSYRDNLTVKEAFLLAAQALDDDAGNHNPESLLEALMSD